MFFSQFLPSLILALCLNSILAVTIRQLVLKWLPSRRAQHLPTAPDIESVLGYWPFQDYWLAVILTGYFYVKCIERCWPFGAEASVKAISLHKWVSKSLSPRRSRHKQTHASEKAESVNTGQNNPSHFVSLPWPHQDLYFTRRFTNNIILIIFVLSPNIYQVPTRNQTMCLKYMVNKTKKFLDPRNLV